VTVSSRDASRSVGEFVDDLVRIGVRILVAELSLQEGAARQVMANVADDLLCEYERTSFYVPVAYNRRNRELYGKYAAQGGQTAPHSAARVRALSEEYGLTERQVYSIVARERSITLARLQPVLPGFDSQV